MKRISLIVIASLTGIALVAFAAVSIVEGAPIVLHKADVVISSHAAKYFSNRYQHVVERYQDREAESHKKARYALQMGEDLCENQMAVCEYLDKVEASAMPARKVLK